MKTKCGTINCLFFNYAEENHCRVNKQVTRCDDYEEYEPDICPDCNGSGEGLHDGTNCQNPACKGGLINLTD